MPIIIFMSVLLPAPFPPIMAETSPGERLMLMPFNTWLSPNDLQMFLHSSNFTFSTTTFPPLQMLRIQTFVSYSLYLFFKALSMT